MSVKIKNDTISGDSGINMLDFTIDTSGIQVFTANCTVVESKQSTYNMGNCTTTDCTTTDCNTVNCTTVQCNTVQCTTVNCTTIECTTVDCKVVECKRCSNCPDCNCDCDCNDS